MKGTTMILEEHIQEQKRISDEIKRRKLQRYEISEREWQEGINKSYHDQIELEKLMNFY